MRNKQILLSGRAVVTNAANVPADRYTFLHLSDAEPNLGTANANGWVLVYDTSTPGNRLWSKNLITAYDHANSAYQSQNTTGSYANSAFVKSNSAYESQNVTGTYANNAYIHANAANLQANSAYESQNVTGTYANNAYTHANAANLQANSAYESQNVTGTYANNAYLHSNAAFIKANSAYESQNVTGTYANNAYTHANAAFLKANSAYESQNVTGTYANNAYLHANSAYQSQNTTGAYANAAFLKANSAYESQNVTGTYANNAYLHANSAYESQNTTGVYANSAFLKANAAYESQNVTGTYANNAYLHANSAYESQNVTGTYANAAFLKANSAYESQNVTGTYANNAYLHANAAFDKANAAYESQNVTGVYANTAFEFANSAGQYANAAFDYANSAYTHSNAAFVFANTRYSSNGGEISGDVVITGNLTISGNVTTVSANTLTIQDNIIYLNDGGNTANPDLGVVGAYDDGTYQHTGIFRDATDGIWKFFDGYLPEPDASPFIDTSNSSFRIANLTANVITDVIWLRGYDPLDASNAAYEHANAAYASQNTTGEYSNAAFTHANAANLQANSAYESQNVTGTYANNAYLHANAAFDKANAAYESQNVTGTYANNSYIHANSAYSSQNTTGVYANAAFLKANSSYESQNVTGTYANNAYIHANSSYESQNTTGVYANAAFLKANAAYESQNVTGTYANNAYLHANSAYESQNVTGTYANSAYLHANSAYESQNTTGTYANAAFLKANSAYESQNVTGTYANNAYLHANSAYGSQNTTGVYANAAFLHANSAYGSQNTTGSYANSAFLKANSAYESQNVTGTYANNAYLHANSAYESQNVTGSYANSAFIKANSAYDSQNTTGFYANSAYEHANAAFIKANAAVFSITTNVNELFSNTSSGNIRLGLATVNPNTGEWGSSSQVPVLTIDKFGRVISAYNSEIVIPPGTYIYPNTGQLTTNANFGNVLIGLANVNSNIGYFGSEFAIPKINVDGYGRIVNVANVTVSIPQGTYIVNSNLITANSQTGNVVLGLQESGVIAGTYGGQNYTPVIEVDVYGRIIYANNVSTMGSGAGVVNTLSSIVRSSYTATAGQTAFLTAASFEPGYVDVYINGLHLSPDDYGANGSLGQIIINSPTLLEGDVVDIQTVTTYVVNSNTTYQKETFVATAGQTTFTTSYDPGHVNVYLNGLRLFDGTDYNGSNGINIVFPIPLEVDDIVEVEKIGRSEILIANTTLATRNTITVTANGDSTFIVGGGYRVGFTDVYMNGVKLNVPGDVQAINGNTITILSATTEVGDIIEVNSLGPYYSLANAIPVTGGIVYGSLNVLQNVSANHANVNQLHFSDGTMMTTAASGSGDGVRWKIASANVTANIGEGLLVDTTTANVYITLNASPALGNTTRIVDMTGNFGINNCIVKGNGQKIMGSTDDLVISSNNAGIGLVYSNATHGWRLIENP